jgi:hypothetical protein
VSHIVEIQTEVRDAAAIRAACQRLQIPMPVYGEARLFSGSKTGWQVKLLDWRYPVICDVSTGKIDFDNFNNRWGEQQHLNSFLQAYAVEKAKIESRRKGHTVTEQSLVDGSIKLTIQVAGGAA